MDELKTQCEPRMVTLAEGLEIANDVLEETERLLDGRVGRLSELVSGAPIAEHLVTLDIAIGGQLGNQLTALLARIDQVRHNTERLAELIGSMGQEVTTK